MYIKDNATVTFTQSNVYIKELKTKKNVTIEFSGCTNLFINKKIKFQKNTTFNANGNQVLMYVDDKVEVEEGSDITARIYANDEEIKVKGVSQARGSPGVRMASATFRACD